MARQLPHDTPSWVTSDAIYFLTLTAKKQGENQFCHPALGSILLDSVKWRNDRHIWYCSLALLMPDHIHLLVSFPPEQVITEVIRDWKRWLARVHGVEWQDGFFDHRLRQDESLAQKGDYILHNPVRAGLVERAEDWVYKWMPTV